MPMPGAESMSMMWMRMPAQTWAGAAASFTGMWLVMMIPMMLPAVAPELWRHREAAVRPGARSPGALSAIAGMGYYFVWALAGVAVFAAAAPVAALASDHPALARAEPIVVAATVAIAGAIQLTAWKARRLAGCRGGSCCDAPRAASIGGAWRDGVLLGLRCAECCGNLMVVPLVFGAMDVRAMAAVVAAVAAERLVPHGERVARASGVVLVAAGAVLIARAVGA